MADDWRRNLRPSSFRGVEFFVDAAGRAGGRRQALFEFPKKDTPYAEDMGRRARRFPVTAYLIGDDYQAQRDALIAALEQEGAGLLVHYTFGTHRVSVDTYSVSERRERGRMCEMEMQFVEAGRKPGLSVADDTASRAKAAAATAADESAKAADKKAAADDGVIAV
jgi:prophage DNA circulation protein